MQEQADLESVLEDMYEKVEELQQVLKEHVSTKNALKVPLLAHCLTHYLLLASMCLCFVLFQTEVVLAAWHTRSAVLSCNITSLHLIMSVVPSSGPL